MKRKLFITAGLICISSYVFSQVPDSLPKGAVQVFGDSIQWTAGPETLPKGLMMCVLYGNPKEAGPFVLRFKLPKDYILPVHWHSTDEMVTVLEGSMHVGYGEKFRITKAKVLTAGSFYVNPAKQMHYVFSGKEGAIIQLNAMGPWTIEFLKELKQNVIRPGEEKVK